MVKRAAKLLEMLNNAGYEAYFVGGCVRDFLMDKSAHDIDITTNALPEQVRAVFIGYTVIPTGIKHGTVTVLMDGVSYEITTYRIDGGYTDGRRPDCVEFTSSIEADLARRDFTMNAIAMDINENIVDPFGGAEDIKNHIIRCVGAPEKRFKEDALRIMRAIRFASKLGFKIEKTASDAIHSRSKSLSAISRERIRNELDKLICGENCVEVLLDYSDVITAIIPEFAPCIGFEQHSPYHRYDVWEHTVRALAAAPADDLRLRRSLLFHDIGKPQCFTLDENSRGHFKGHAEVSAQMAKKIMVRLRYDGTTITEAFFLIGYHREKIRNRIEVKRLLSKLHLNLFLWLIELKKCDNLAKQCFVLEENDKLDYMAELARDVCAKGECFWYNQLAVNGNDIAELGFKGKEIGCMLQELLYLVIEEKLVNNKESLLDYVKGRKK